MLRSITGCLFILSLAFSLSFSRPAAAQGGEARFALVIGDAQYAEPLATAANDAGLIADSLRAAGFDVMGAANLDQDALRRAFRDFLEKAAQGGPDAIAFVYLSGLGLQYEGENYFAPVGAVIARDADIPLQAVRVSDFTRALAALPLRGRIVVLDAARANNFAKGGQLAGGLALVDADPGALYAFNAAPGTIAPNEPGPYGAYAQALAEMLRAGGASLDEIFSRARLRVDQLTRGAFTPWDASKIAPPIVLLEGAPNAPAQGAAQSYAALESRPINSFSPGEAYAAALQRDTFEGYEEFLTVYPNDPLARRVRALLAARREALTWRRTYFANTPDAYWSYMQRYPHGPHVFDARRRLALLTAPVEPPPRFDVYDFGGLPPPPQVEYEIIDRPVVVFYSNDYPPPPPPPIYFLPPPPREFISLPPPPLPPHPGFLPIPAPIPLPYAHPNGRPGVFTQQNFGQQGPVGAGPGAQNPATVIPPAGGGQLNHALPQGNGVPPAASPTGRPNVGPGGVPAAPAPAPIGKPGVAPAVGSPPANGAVEPNHVPPRGDGAPAVAPRNEHPAVGQGGGPVGIPVKPQPGASAPVAAPQIAPRPAAPPPAAIKVAPPASPEARPSAPEERSKPAPTAQPQVHEDRPAPRAQELRQEKPDQHVRPQPGAAQEKPARPKPGEEQHRPE